MRYGELRRVIAGITNTMLAQSLRELETDGLIRRTVYDGRPVRVDYDLTDKTEVLIPILLELQAWGEQNIQGPKQ
ncbi:winged helix-turn-helix transcriptional regulator [Mitsuokella jalaludinii]|uniref:winged helix-turn-helix transcriptional regulator n=1 Tax=Mitsuokella jalaludinii TaxID=187979 RepID=UPI003C6D73E1